jgi:hypothetical protein
MAGPICLNADLKISSNQPREFSLGVYFGIIYKSYEK